VVTAPPKSGPLTQAELQSVWESAVDAQFSQPLEQAGEGGGFEVYTQAWAVMARVSQAIDASTQAMFVLPWSGQSGPPASGGAFATVTLVLSRTGLLDLPLVLIAGTLVEEQVVDWGYPTGVPVLTGRRYALTQTAVFLPGQQGPISVTAQAERIGTGYNNPMPGTLVVVDQPGTEFTNAEATVRGLNYPGGVVGPAAVQQALIDSIDEADAFVPQHVGQYLSFSAGANAGKVARAVAWSPPVPPTTGGTLQLALEQSVASFAGHFTGTFQVGESLTLKSGASVTGYGVLEGVELVGGSCLLVFVKRSGSAVTTVVGNVSGASATIDVELVNLDLTPEVGNSPGAGATWSVLDWVDDWGLTCTNPASPQGGLHAMLDALGREKNVDRSGGEPDSTYRQRVAQLADVVSPNAIRRTLNRTIPGIPWCFREAGQATYPGFFFADDVTGKTGDFFDYDRVAVTGVVTGAFLDGEPVRQIAGGIVATGHACVLAAAAPVVPGPPGASTLTGVAGVSGTFATGSPIVGLRSGASTTVTAVAGGLSNANRFRVMFSFLTMRAWFYVGVPPISAGEFGFAYDTHPFGAYDAAPYPDFYDGFPYLSALTYRAVYNAVEKVRAGGVGWTLYEETGPCP
jgi:hypothetical protein